MVIDCKPILKNKFLISRNRELTDFIAAVSELPDEFIVLIKKQSCRVRELVPIDNGLIG